MGILILTRVHLLSPIRGQKFGWLILMIEVDDGSSALHRCPRPLILNLQKPAGTSNVTSLKVDDV